MKQLTLVRHAKSSWKYPELDDFDRPLNKRGKRDLPCMADRLAHQNIIPDLLITSSAVRAYKTACAIKTRLNLLDTQFITCADVYESSYETLLYVLQNIENKHQHVMLTGHNPGLEMLSFYLIQESVDKFPTAAFMNLHLSITNWEELAEGCATCSLFDYPKKHRSGAD